MTDNEKRIAIAKWCGWKHEIATHANPIERDGMRLPNSFAAWDIKQHCFWHPDREGVFADCPDYLGDLNAIHEAEKKLSTDGFEASEWATYQEFLWNDVNKGIPFQNERVFDTEYMKNFIHSPAKNRADALLKTLGFNP